MRTLEIIFVVLLVVHILGAIPLDICKIFYLFLGGSHDDHLLECLESFYINSWVA